MNDLVEASSEAPADEPECVVMKFGGTSVEDAAAIRRVCQTGEATAPPHRPVVVVSALAKVTDQLLNAGRAAAEGALDAAREIRRAACAQRHETVASELVEGTNSRLCLWTRARTGLHRCWTRHRGRERSGRSVPPGTQDRFLGAGESLSVKTGAAALRPPEWTSPGGCRAVHRHRRRPHPGHAAVGRNQRAAAGRAVAGRCNRDGSR